MKIEKSSGADTFPEHVQSLAALPRGPAAACQAGLFRTGSGRAERLRTQEMPVLQQGRYQVRMRIVQMSPTPKSQGLQSKGDLALVTSRQMWIRAGLGRHERCRARLTHPAKVSQPEPRPQLHVYPLLACTHREEKGKERLFR